VPLAEPNQQKQQNVTFVDEMPGDEVDYNSTLDPLRDAAMTQDATLDEFFSRPLRIFSTNWQVGASLNEEIFPWALYFSNPLVSNRINNYKLLTAELCIKVVINGNAFHYGRAMLSYTPFVGYDDLTRLRDIQAELVEHSQRPKVFIDPTTSQGGCLTLPFSWWQNALDITTGTYDGESVDNDWYRMGVLMLKHINLLKHAYGAADSATIDIFAWAKNVKYAIPTGRPCVLLSPQSLIEPMAADEYTGTGVISRPATAVANFLSKVKVPMLQNYVTATAMAVKLVGAVASMFGYSRPMMLQSSRYQPNTKHNMASSNLEDDAAKLTVDSKQELTIDPTIYGIAPMDEMDIQFIASRESYLATFNWAVSSVTAPPEALLWNSIVDPINAVTYSSGGGEEIHMPAVMFASVPFNRWRGSLKYRFQVVCSKFHRGRLKVVYDPSGTQTNAEYNSAYTSIVDISNTTDFEIVAGWGQATTYRKMNDITNPMTFNMNTTPIDYDSSSFDYGNGTIAVYVVTELTVPNTTVDNDIQINVFVSAGDDFEVAMPTGERLTRLRLRGEAEVPPQAQARMAEDNPFKNIEPMSEENSTPANDSMGISEGPTTVETFGNSIPITDPANLMHFGESIRSFRQLLKRYNQHETISPFTKSGGNVDGQNLLKIQRPSLPFEPGYAPKWHISQPFTVPNDISGRGYAYSLMTTMRYLSTGYVGWRGSIRYMVDLSALGCGCKALGPVSVTRYSECTPETETSNVLPPSGNQGQRSQLIAYDDVSGQEGFIVQNTSLNETMCFEVPYYSERRFSPARSLTNFDRVAPNYGPCWKLRFPFFMKTAELLPLSNSAVRTYVAAGEDFSFGFFIGAPTFFYEGIPPV